MKSKKSVGNIIGGFGIMLCGILFVWWNVHCMANFHPLYLGDHGSSPLGALFFIAIGVGVAFGGLFLMFTPK